MNYKKYANFDISNNIGVLATLYNLGAEKQRALQLAKKNQELVKEGKQKALPVENFYGWYMNKKETTLKPCSTSDGIKEFAAVMLSTKKLI